MNKLGINFIGSFGLSYDACLKIIADTGFDSVFDIYTDDLAAEKFANAATKYHLKMNSFHAPFRGTNGMWLEGEAGEEMLEKLFATVKNCAEYGVPVAVVHVSEGYTPPEISEIGLSRFDRLVSFAAEKGVTVAFENLRVPRYLFAVMERYKDVKNVGFCWDTGHEACFTDGREFMPDFGERLCFTHIHDNLAEPSGDLHRIPFDGVLDFNRIATHLRQRKWKGDITFEVFPDNYELYKEMTAEEFYKRAFDVAVKFRGLI